MGVGPGLGQTSTTAGAVTNTPPGSPWVVLNIVLIAADTPSTDSFFETASVFLNGTDDLGSNTTPAGSLTPATTNVPIADTSVTLTGADESATSSARRPRSTPAASTASAA